MKRIVVLVITAAMVFAAPANAQFGTGLGTIAGTVLDAQGKPVPDASVTIQTSDGQHPHATHTDAKGHFEFTRYDSGQYDLRAYCSGVFSEWTKRAVIKPAKTTEITLTLPSAHEKKYKVTANY
ncbi:MAG: carboxypeptidase-like regulatory domain-containing protein [Candidatus Acidiferrales bacterium]